MIKVHIKVKMIMNAKANALENVLVYIDFLQCLLVLRPFVLLARARQKTFQGRNGGRLEFFPFKKFEFYFKLFL